MRKKLVGEENQGNTKDLIKVSTFKAEPGQGKESKGRSTRSR
jgi:hypothetical protein